MSAEEQAPRRGEPAPILLLAGFPDEDDETVGAGQLLEIEEAILSLSRAALARGRRIALPGDPVVAPLVAGVAAEYASPQRTEARDRAPWLVDVLLTGGGDEELERTLAGRGQVRGMSFGDREEGQRGERHRLTPAALNTVLPLAAVVIGGDSELADEFTLALEFGVKLSTIGPTLAGELARSDLPARHDATARILDRIKWSVGEAREDAPDHERRIPYPFVMQQLVAEWEDEWNGPSEEWSAEEKWVEEDEEEHGFG